MNPSPGSKEVAGGPFKNSRSRASGDTTILFQAIFDVRGESSFLRAYEVLARFPTVGKIPTGLWFSVAHQIGLGMDLELAAARKAMAVAHRLPEDTLLFVNASPAVAPILIDSAPREVTTRLVLDLPYTSSTDPPRPGLILLDLNMPRKDGRQALAAARKSW